MPYPDDTDLEITCDFPFGADTTTSPSTWTWTDLTSRLVAEPINIRRGLLVGPGAHRCAATTITLLNNDGALTPFLPTSTYWPYVDVGTPARIRVRATSTPWIADTFTRTVASGWGAAESGFGQTTSLNWSTSGASVNGAGGVLTFTATNQIQFARMQRPHTDALVQFDVTLPALTTGDAVVVAATLRQPQNRATYLWPSMEFQPSGAVRWVLYRDPTGDVLTSVTQPGLTYSPGVAVRCEIELIGPWVRCRAWLASGTKPTAWALTYQLTDHLTGSRYAGLQAWLYSTNTNTLPFAVTFDNVTFSQPRWPRIEGYITDVRPTFQPLADGTVHSVVQVDIGGIGSRSEQQSAAAWSPLRRSLQQSTTPPKVYWPCEDAQNATTAASAFPAGTPMTVTGPAVFNFDTGETDDVRLRTYGTQALCSLAAGASLAGGVSPAVGSSAWTVSGMIQVYTPGIGGGVTEARMLEWTTPGGTHTRWALVRTMTGHTVRAYNDTTGTTTDVITYANGFNVLIGYDVTATQSGGSINVALWGNAVQLATGTVTGTLAGVARVKANPDRVNTTASTDPFGIRFLVGHIMVHDTATTAAYPYYFDSGVLLTATTGWGYEYAHRRFARLCTEERVPYMVAGAPYTSGTTQLNVQQSGSFTDLVSASIEAESGGLVYEDGFGYTHVPRTQRYNQPVRLTVDMSTYRYAGDDPTAVLVPSLDARGPNFWTVKRTGGSEASAAAPLAYRNRRGTIADSATLDVLSDGDCVNHAGWRVHLFTDGLQANYPQLTLDLAANPGLIEDYMAVTFGDRVQRTNQPTVAGYGVIDQVVDQMQETFTPRSAGGPGFVASLDCSPAAVWDVAQFDVDRFDSMSTTLGTAVNSSASSFAVKTVNPLDVWDTAAVPYDWLVDGERVTVTAISSAVLSGGTYNQTATVTRSVNGVVRAHAVGAEVHLADLAYLAL